MRITNSMQVNNLLLNIQRNLTALNKLQQQQASTKKIQYASEDPIIAGRALRFRTQLAETQQYLKNVETATSWLNTTQGAFNTVNDVILRLKHLTVQGSNETFNSDQRKTIMSEIEELRNELCATINESYAGRYVFSGYRTDKPTILTSDVVYAAGKPESSFKITEHFGQYDINTKMMYDPGNGHVISTNSDSPMTYETTVIKLGYENITTPPTQIVINETDELGAAISPVTILITSTIKSTDADAYNPGDNEVYFLQDTGELVLGKDTKAKLEGLYPVDPGHTVNIDVTYTKQGFSKGDKNPITYFDCEDTETGKVYNMSTQNFEFEFGVSNKMQVNTLGKDVLSSRLLNDLDDLINTINNMRVSTPEELKKIYPTWTDEQIDEWMQKESKALQDVFTDKFTAMIGKMEIHDTTIRKHNTELGTRLKRLDLIKNRLLDEEVNIEEIKSNNEDANMPKVLIDLSTMLGIYESSLATGANIIQKTLVDFIR